jgi:hypothetical protein
MRRCGQHGGASFGLLLKVFGLDVARPMQDADQLDAILGGKLQRSVIYFLH